MHLTFIIKEVLASLIDNKGRNQAKLRRWAIKETNCPILKSLGEQIKSKSRQKWHETCQPDCDGMLTEKLKFSWAIPVILKRFTTPSNTLLCQGVLINIYTVQKKTKIFIQYVVDHKVPKNKGLSIATRLFGAYYPHYFRFEKYPD